MRVVFAAPGYVFDIGFGDKEWAEVHRHGCKDVMKLQKDGRAEIGLEIAAQDLNAALNVLVAYYKDSGYESVSRGDFGIYPCLRGAQPTADVEPMRFPIEE